VDWGAVFAQALDVATQLWSARVSEEIVSSGIERVFAGDAPWDPSGKRTLAGHVVAVGFNTLRNQRRSAQRRRRADFVAGATQAYEERALPRPDEALEDKAERADRFAELWKRCEGFPDARAILEAEKLGVRGQKEQTAHCKLTEHAWTIARKHIGRVLKAIGEDEEREEREEREEEP
jgi:hypothetical protein